MATIQGQYPKFITATQGAEILGFSRATWFRRVADGTLPRPLKLGGSTRWKLSDVTEAIERADAARFSR